MSCIDELDKEMELRFGATRVKLRRGPLVDNIYYNVAVGTRFGDVEKFAIQNELRAIIDHETSDIVIEVPRQSRQMIWLEDLLVSDEHKKSKAHLPIVLGVDTLGKPVIHDLQKMQNLLIGGRIGSGKSTLINSIITSLIARLKPEECKFVLIDTKGFEFNYWSKNAYLYQPIITDCHDAIDALENITTEINTRLAKLATQNLKTIEQYNQNNAEKLPYIVVIMDEFADLIECSESEFIKYIKYIYAKAQTVGIHLIAATKNVQKQIITDVLLAHFPSRIAFCTRNKAESELILDESGAENLCCYGDTLFSECGKQPVRIHTPYIDVETSELNAI